MPKLTKILTKGVPLPLSLALTCSRCSTHSRYIFIFIVLCSLGPCLVHTSCPRIHTCTVSNLSLSLRAHVQSGTVQTALSQISSLSASAQGAGLNPVTVAALDDVAGLVQPIISEGKSLLNNSAFRKKLYPLSSLLTSRPSSLISSHCFCSGNFGS